MGGWEAERARVQFARRREVVGLPMVGLRLHAHLLPSPDDPRWCRQPRAVGVGPGGEAVALWDDRAGDARLLTRHGSGAGGGDEGVVFQRARAAAFVQPLPDGRVLLVDARSWRGGSRGGETAEVRDGDGGWVAAGHLGDAVGQVLATVTGDVWVGYFDEAAALGRGLGGHGLVRFGPDLQPRWLYPPEGDLPRIDDCESLNASGQTAWVSVYSARRLVSVSGPHGVDHGRLPRGGICGVLVEGGRAVLIGGYAAEYDLATPVRVGPGGIEPAGPPARVVLPDGMELRGARLTCRGTELHAVIEGSWYRASLDDFDRDD